MRQHKKNKVLSLALAALLASPGVQAVDLLGLYKQAQEQDATFAAAKSAYAAAQEKLPQGRSQLLPTVALTANAFHNEFSVNPTEGAPFPAGEQDYNEGNYALVVSQPLYRRQNWVAYKESRIAVDLAKLSLSQARQELMLRVAQAYFDVLLAQDNLSLANAQKEAISEQLAMAKRNFELGRATVTDINEAQARYDLITALEIASQNDIEIRRQALRQLVDTLPTNLARLPEQVSLQPPIPADLQAWIAKSTQSNLNIRQAQIGVNLASKARERVGAARHPTLDLVARYSDNEADGGPMGFALNTEGPSVGLQFNLPLYTGGAISSAQREAELEETRTKQLLEATRRQVEQGTRQAYLGVVSGLAQVKALEQALVSSQSTVDSTRLGVEVGVRTNVDLLNAQQQLYSAKRDLAQARYNVLLNRLRLSAAAGELNESVLAEVSGKLSEK